MRHAQSLLVVLLVLTFFTSVTAHAQTIHGDAELVNACSSALQKDSIYSSKNNSLSFLISSFFSAQQSAAHSASGGVGYGSVQLKGGQSSSSSASATSSEDMSLNQTESASYIASVLSSGGAGAFTECVDTVFSKPGLHLATISANDKSVVFRIRYTPSPNTPDIKRHLVLFTNGDLATGQSYVVPNSGIERDIQVDVVNPSQSLQFTVEVRSADNVVMAAENAIVPLVTSVEGTTTTASIKGSRDRSLALCGGGHHTEQGVGDSIILVPDRPDAVIDLPNSMPTLLSKIHGDRLDAPSPRWKWDSPPTPLRAAVHAECNVPNGNDFYEANVKLDGIELITTPPSISRYPDNHLPTKNHRVY